MPPLSPTFLLWLAGVEGEELVGRAQILLEITQRLDREGATKCAHENNLELSIF